MEKSYILSRKAVISEAESNEYIFFHADENLSADDVKELSLKAWEEGLSRVEPHKSHRNSDVTVVITADKVSDEAFEEAKKTKFYKSYKMSFNGWSVFRIVILETSSGRLGFNRRGSELKKIFKFTVKQCKEESKVS